MILDSISVSDFRNIESATVTFSPKENVLVGENAQGKTNLIEAIYLLACGKSFRVSKYRELIAHGAQNAVVTVRVSGEKAPFELKMVLDRKNGKSILKNGIRLSKLSEFLGSFRVVLFCPEHLGLIKDGPGKRRSFIDSAICQIRPYYASLLNEFNQIEAQRAALLKQSVKKSVPRELFFVWEERLAEVSVKIASLRGDYIKELTKRAPEHFSRISGGKDQLTLRYVSDVAKKDLGREEMKKQYLAELEAGFETDQKYGFTQKGIHRDDLEIVVNDYAARGFASQGQQRSAVLALKLAEGEISRDMTGQEPVYLLDDVLSELDENRRNYITSGLAGKQVILTGTDEEDFSFVETRYRVREGSFSQ